MRKIDAFSLAGLMLIATTAVAQVDCAKEALFKDLENVKNDYVLKTILIESTDKNEWDSKKSGGSVEAVIYGVPIKADYDEASNWASGFRQRTGMSVDERNRTAAVTSRLSERGLEAYKTCVLANSKQPFVLSVKRASKNLIVVEGLWRPSDFEFQALREVTVQVQGGKVLTSPPKRPVAREEWQFQIARDKNEEVSALVQMNFENNSGQEVSYSREVYVPPFEDIKVQKKVRNRESSQVYSLRPGSGSVGDSRPVLEQASEGWQIIRGSADVKWTLIQGNGVSTANALSTQPNKITGTIRISHPPAHAAEAADAKIVWQEEQTVIIKDGVEVGPLAVN